jgi:hypothetical protein
VGHRALLHGQDSGARAHPHSQAQVARGRVARRLLELHVVRGGVRHLLELHVVRGGVRHLLELGYGAEERHPWGKPRR